MAKTDSPIRGGRPTIIETLRDLATEPELDREFAAKLRDAIASAEDVADLLQQMLDLIGRPVGKGRR